MSTPGTAKLGAGSGSRLPSSFVLAAIFVLIFVLHWPLLKLPYIWDEAGYYVPAARDILLSGSLIPRSTVSNAHPPLVLAWVAAAWKAAGYSPLVTHTTMLLVAAFALLGLFRLARQVANEQVAIASTLCTAVYSVFFTQSSFVHLDMAAAGLTFWGLASYLKDRKTATVIWFSLAALAKETAILAPCALLGWELIGIFFAKNRLVAPARFFRRRISQSVYLLLPVLPLSAWFAYHYAKTGFVFGNPEFFRYNVAATLHPVRIVLAAGMRIWQVVGFMHLWMLTLTTALAMFLPAQTDGGVERSRISVPVQAVFAVLIGAYVAAMSVVGGAVLARYMLPVIPLGIVVCVSTLWRRVIYWRTAVALVVFALAAAMFVNPPYGFSFEDNLAYRDYIVLHQQAEDLLTLRFPSARVLTAWPASDELTRPYLGYVAQPRRVVRIDNFSFEQIESAAEAGSSFDVALVFSTKYLPPQSLLARWPAWERLQTKYFDFHRDLPIAVAAQVLGGRVVYTAERNGQWIGIIAMEHAVDARLLRHSSPGE